MSDASEGTRKKGRSPSYPAVDLQTAVDRVRQVYEHEHQHLTPPAAVFRHWGYKSLAGNANLVIAALRKFGLMEYEGSGEGRKAKVSDLAVEILEHPDSERRRQALERAALLPTIHQELWSKYGAKLPSEDALRWELERERNFTRSGAADFIPQYRATLSYAGLLDANAVGSQEPRDEPSADDQDEDDERDTDQQPRQDQQSERDGRPEVPGSMSYYVPVAYGENVIIEGQFPLSEPKWEQFMATLDVMKHVLVKPERESDDAPEG